MIVEPLDQRDRHVRLNVPSRANALEFGRNYLGVVEHERIARLKQFRKIEHRAIVYRLLGRRIDREQPRRVARACRAKRYQLLGQIEIELGDAHMTTSRPDLIRASRGYKL